MTPVEFVKNTLRNHWHFDLQVKEELQAVSHPSKETFWLKLADGPFYHVSFHTLSVNLYLLDHLSSVFDTKRISIDYAGVTVEGVSVSIRNAVIKT